MSMIAAVMLLLGAQQTRLTSYRDQLLRDEALKERVVDGYKLCYADAGKGPVIVLLHGLSGSLYDWRGNLKALAETHRVLALDLLGAGESDKPEDADYGVFAQARRVRRLLEGLGIERATLVGNSYGGGVALAFAQDWPDRVDRLVLIDTVCYPEDIPTYVDLCSVPWASEQVAKILPVRKMAERTLKKCYGDPSRFSAEEVEMYVKELDPGVRRTAVIRTVRALLPDDPSEFLAGLKRVRAKTLIIWGEKDQTRPVEHGKRLAKDLPDARLKVLEGVGHLPNQEVPDRVNNLIVEFLK